MDLQSQLQQQLRGLIVTKSKLIIEKSVQPEESFLYSHFNGKPYFEAGEEWPVNTRTGQPLEFVFQIRNEESLPLFPEIGILQFYYDAYGEDYIVDGSQTYGYQIKVYQHPASQQYFQVDRPVHFLAKDYHQISFETKESVPDWDSLEFANSNGMIQKLCQDINPKNPSRVYREEIKGLIGEQKMGSWLGGYPQWLQGPSYQGEFLMQIDSEANFMWGDSGLLYFFYNIDNQNPISFEMQSC